MIKDDALARDLMRCINLPGVDDYVDPWRLYQDCALLDRAVRHCTRFLMEHRVDIIAAVSELGLPLAVSVGLGLLRKDANAPSVVVLSIRHGELNAHPEVAFEGKNVVLCDDILAGGTHMRDQIQELIRRGAHPTAAVVLLDNLQFPQRDPVEDIQSHFGENLLALTDSTFYG